MRSLRRIDVLLNEDTGEKFDLDDIVKIETYSKIKYIGRLEWIDILELTLDMSDRFESRTQKIKFEDITSIEKADQ